MEPLRGNLRVASLTKRHSDTSPHRGTQVCKAAERPSPVSHPYPETGRIRESKNVASQRNELAPG